MTKANEPPFADTDLALCVLEAMVCQGLVSTDVRIPELAPEDDDDLDDESESWRDRVDNNQTAARDELVTLVGQHRDKLPLVKEVTGVILELAEELEPDIHDLSGIGACTGLEKLEIWTTRATLDLSPLTALPALAELDLTCAGRLKNLRPLLEMKALRKVTGDIHERVAAELRSRGVEVEARVT